MPCKTSASAVILASHCVRLPTPHGVQGRGTGLAEVPEVGNVLLAGRRGTGGVRACGELDVATEGARPFERCERMTNTVHVHRPVGDSNTGL